MRPHLYIDLDGTLTDPHEGISNCIVYALEALGFPRPSDEWLFNAIGPSLWDSFPAIVGGPLTGRAVELYRERFNDIGWLENRPYDGIHAALESLCHSGAQLFVATAKPWQAAERILEHFALAEYFDDVFGSEADGTRSRKSDLLAYAIQQNEVTDTRMMIGDRGNDLLGATANGMIPVGVSYGYGSIKELQQAGAVAIASSPGELAATARDLIQGD